jgi:glyoxylase-like metal-dependent hydrolase (beta-lactamase superfamily II)
MCEADALTAFWLPHKHTPQVGETPSLRRTHVLARQDVPHASILDAGRRPLDSGKEPAVSLRFLDCAPMHPWWPHWDVGGTCIMVETDQGLVLVDTGVGLHDHENPYWIVRLFALGFGLQRDPETTAVRQLARRGIAPESIRHIVLTHLHFDHAGGLPDFPQAQVHVHRRELEAHRRPRSWIELAYDRADASHGPRWVLYDQASEDWLGFAAIRLPFTPVMYLIPLFGHTRGHCGVAIQDGEGWTFQCGDALPLSAEFDVTPEWVNRLVLGRHGPRLKAFTQQHPEVHLLAGHMRRLFFESAPD